MPTVQRSNQKQEPITIGPSRIIQVKPRESDNHKPQVITIGQARTVQVVPCPPAYRREPEPLPLASVPPAYDLAVGPPKPPAYDTLSQYLPPIYSELGSDPVFMRRVREVIESDVPDYIRQGQQCVVAAYLIKAGVGILVAGVVASIIGAVAAVPTGGATLPVLALGAAAIATGSGMIAYGEYRMRDFI